MDPIHILAILDGVENLALQEEILKTGLINCHALVLKLQSADPVETVAILCYGRKV